MAEDHFKNPSLPPKGPWNNQKSAKKVENLLELAKTRAAVQKKLNVELLRETINLREFVKTHVLLTPGALLVGCELQFVLHFRGIRRRVQKSCFDQ